MAHLPNHIKPSRTHVNINNSRNKDIALIDIIVLFTCIVSIISIILLSCNLFKSLTVIIFSFIILAVILFIIIFVFKYKFQIKDKRFDIIILPVLFIAVLFRFQPYLYLAGGQDEGLYIAMSKQFEEQGKYVFADRFREKLSENEKIIYDNDKNGIFPGVVNLGNNNRTMHFYPLHPMLMAIFGNILGDDNRVYSLVFLSLLSVIAFYLIAYEISGKRKFPAYLAALFIAMNPLLTFMSKFPVSEMTALAFSSFSFYYLLKYYQDSKEEKYGNLYPVLSFLLFNSLCYTRISAFMYIPFFLILPVIIMIFVKNRKVKMGLILTIFSIILFFVLSILYYYHFEPIVYSGWLYRYIIRVFGKNWMLISGFFLLFTVLILIISSIIFKKDKNIFIKEFFLNNINLIFFIAFLVLLVLSGIDFYQLGFTSKYTSIRWEYGNQGFRDIRFTAIYNIFLYLSPIGFFVVFYALSFFIKHKNPLINLLIGFILLFWSYVLIFNKIVNYQFYYARYFSTEVIPYTLLFLALSFDRFLNICNNRYGKTFLYFLISFMLVYFGFFASFQFLGKEGADTGFFTQLKGKIAENDILFYNEPYEFSYNIIGTPLKYYYDLNLLNLNDLNNIELINAFVGSGKSIFVLSPYRVGNLNYLEYLDEYKYENGFYFNGTHLHYQDNNIKPSIRTLELPFYRYLIPSQYCVWERIYYLYKLNKKSVYFHRSYSIIRPREMMSGHLLNFYNDYIWTSGDGIIKDLNINLQADNKYIVIQTFGWNPDRNIRNSINLNVFIEGINLKYITFKNNAYYFILDKKIKEIKVIRLKSTTFVPSALGINKDNRVLGIDVDAIYFTNKL